MREWVGTLRMNSTRDVRFLDVLEIYKNTLPWKLERAGVTYVPLAYQEVKDMHTGAWDYAIEYLAAHHELVEVIETLWFAGAIAEASAMMKDLCAEITVSMPHATRLMP